MSIITRLFIWIAVASILLTIGLQKIGAVQVGDATSATRIVALSVKASFDQGDKDLQYFSYWSGKIFCQCKQPKKSDESLEVCFPLGLGEIPSSLYMRWTTTSKNKKTKSTGPVFISLVKYKAEPSEVMAWAQMKELNDPSLTISLVASTGKEKEYTNEEEVEGSIVAWLRNKKGTTCLPLAQVRIPERSILLKYSSDKNGEPSIELTVQSMRIIDFEDDTWELIIKRGNRHLNLPADPEDAECRSFTAHNDVKQTESSKNITELQCAFLQAYRAGDIDTSNMKKIIGYVDGYKISEINTDYSQISRNQMQCQKMTNDLVKSGKIKSQNAKPILELNKKFFNPSFPSAGSFGHRAPPPSHTADGPEVTYYVRQSSRVYKEYVPDGTSTHPYLSILQAYDAAKAVDSRRVELIVDEGYYDEPLNLDRNTILRAAPGSKPIIGATITCTRAVHLEIFGFYLMGATSPGALQVLVPGSSVSLADVEVCEAHRYGIYQRGGDIELRAVTVHNTRREAGQIEYGTGMLLQDGVQAFLVDVTLNDNESSGIILRGLGSNLSGRDITLRRNKLHTDFYTDTVRSLALPVGAFLIYDQAVANLTSLRMSGNEFVGIGVYRNAEVNVDIGIIDSIRSIRVEGDFGLTVSNNWGGIGIEAKDGGHITMRNFLISHCDLAGVGVSNLGEIDLHEGWISYNPIGVYVAWSFNIGRLCDLVAYYENQIDLDTEGGLPVPGGTPDIPD
jgi:hypothetical protein